MKGVGGKVDQKEEAAYGKTEEGMSSTSVEMKEGCESNGIRE